MPVPIAFTFPPVFQQEWCFLTPSPSSVLCDTLHFHSTNTLRNLPWISLSFSFFFFIFLFFLPLLCCQLFFKGPSTELPSYIMAMLPAQFKQSIANLQTKRYGSYHSRHNCGAARISYFNRQSNRLFNYKNCKTLGSTIPSYDSAIIAFIAKPVKIIGGQNNYHFPSMVSAML